MAATFVPAGPCWICESSSLQPVETAGFEFAIYETQDPGLAEYSGQSVTIRRCASCGFAQPDALPSLDNFFGRMYDQRWSRDWLEREFDSHAKTAIFAAVLDGLERRVPSRPRRLLDVGAHVGRFVALAAARGWAAEGTELNPTTASFARERTGLPIHQVALASLAADGRRFEAVTLTDVLEHIPRPLTVLSEVARVLASGGWVAVKVPSGPSQLGKERLRHRLGRTRRVDVAENLVHVSHFSPRALRLALARAGFTDVFVTVGIPEAPEGRTRGRQVLASAMRKSAYHAARVLPGGTRLPFAFNLQAFARKAAAP